MTYSNRAFRFFKYSVQIMHNSIHKSNARMFPIVQTKTACFNNTVVCVGGTEGDERVQQLFRGLLNGERVSLAESITLVESHHPKKRAQAQELLSLVLHNSRKKYREKGRKSLSFRIGLTGPPGSGKSTFIEAFGKLLTSSGHKVAVLAIDPSSSESGGSLLGDKTRMLELSRDINAYIRPSPAGSYLGGVARNTCDSVVLCECAGYDIIIVETVGVGQSEYAAADMVDMFVLLIPPAGGDVLQGIKRGIVELADVVVVNKADGSLLQSARRIQLEYTSALKFVRRRSKVWRPKVLRVSSITKEGIPKLWEEMLDFWEETVEAGELEAKRQKQYRVWMWNYINHHLKVVFQQHPKVKPLIEEIENKVVSGVITPGIGADMLLHRFFL